MAALYLGSELLETQLTPQENHTAVQFMHRDLSLAYLQNTRVQIFRQLAGQDLIDPTKDGEEIRIRAHLKGQLAILDALIAGALNPPPLAVNGDSQQPSQPE